jgi:hypothetical protein
VGDSRRDGESVGNSWRDGEPDRVIASNLVGVRRECLESGSVVRNWRGTNVGGGEGVGMVIYVELLALPGKLCRFGEKVSNGCLLSLDS